MREIKFRGRRLDNGKWVTGDLLHSKNGKVLINAGTKMFTTYAEVDPNTVGQFTGHRDKKGRDIYEGDILRREWCYRSDPEYDDRGEVTGYNYERTGHIIAPVAFAPCAGFHTKGGYSVMHNPGADEPSLLACTINKLKATKSVIIGNIYDHPELTKSPKQNDRAHQGSHRPVYSPRRLPHSHEDRAARLRARLRRRNERPPPEAPTPVRFQNKRPRKMTFNIKPQIIIGVDPDVEASGLGIINTTNTAGLTIDYNSLPLPELVEEIALFSRYPRSHPVRIFIEAGWLNKGNWHLNPHDSKQVAAAKGRQAGRNHQLGLDLCALLDHRGIPHTEVLPLVKCWKGKDRKITHEELDTIVRWVNGTGLPRSRSNQEERDALLLAWEKSGLPIKC